MLTRSNSCGPESRTAPARVGTLGRCLAWMLVALWAAAAATGMGLLATYANTAGKISPAPASIAPGDDATRPKTRLYMFLHPHCPCSAASVNELAKIMSRCSGRLDATVYFVRPDSQSADWERGSLWNLASSIPGVHVDTDIGGRVAAQFQANTSGEVIVYDRAGQLRFHGGITAARGHAGDNLGATAVIAVAMGGKSNVERSPVFGCPFRADVSSSDN